MRKHSINCKRRAVSLPLVLLFATLLLTLSLVDCIKVREGLSSRNRRELALRAEYAARTGLQRAVSHLSQDSTWNPPVFSGTLTHDPRLSFRVEVLNNYSSTTDTTAPDGSTLPAGRVWLSAVGLVDGQPLSGGLGQAKSVPVRPQTVFDYVVDERRSLYFARGTFVNSLVDSYAGGPPTSYTSYLVPGNPATYRMRAKIHSANEMAIGTLGFVDAQPFVSSDASISNISLANTSVAPVVDSTWPARWKYRVPAALASQPLATPPTTGVILPGRYGDLKVSAGGNVQLESGRYYFRNISLDSGASIILAGSVSDSAPVEIYLGERAVLGTGSIVNPDHAPRHCQIYGVDEENGFSYFRCEENNQVSATLAGLGLQVRFEVNVEFFGAMHCYDFYEGDDSKIHYDESLASQVLEGETEWVLVDQSSL